MSEKSNVIAICFQTYIQMVKAKCIFLPNHNFNAISLAMLTINKHSKEYKYSYIYICIHIPTLTGHFIRFTLLVPGWTPFCLQNCLHSSWHRFNKVLETFLRDFGPYWHNSVMQLLQICRLHIHDANLPFHHIPKVLCWIEIWWLWRRFE